ncbi:E3 ubiquitin-protein ligase CHFR [Leucoagaricus sp. SymC.cos]|nr:E3 ubiquitin-protein ligase CHFR [Leucoagaricus sp. SymC.cos]
MDATTHHHSGIPITHGATSAQVSSSLPSSSSLKRRASSLLADAAADGGRKRLKEDIVDHQLQDPLSQDSRFVKEMAEELKCGCCTELVYNPVLVLPCQHFFCGSCCVLWIRNGGTSCPSCRTPSTIVTPFRALKGTIDAFLRVAPHRARTERERQQADEVYRAGSDLRIPAPPEASPEPNINSNTDFLQPCPHCSRANPFGWVCPQPIPDPNLDPDHAWPLDEGLPPGHGHCGNCEILLALHAPSTTKCDMCSVYFCGINVQGRCIAAPVLAQQPHGLLNVDDFIQCPYVYDCFDGNNVEVDFVIDYMRVQNITPKHIYREIVTYIQSQPRGFQPLIEANIFNEYQNVESGPVEPIPPNPSRARICRLCAAEVFIWGLKRWWIRERQKGFLDPGITSRQDCPHGPVCAHQKDISHAREFNHIFIPPAADSVPDTLHPPPQAQGASAPGGVASSSIPIIPSPEALPFIVDVQEDPLTSSPTTPDFRDAIDAFH